jgi:peptide chain release factor 2
MKLKNYGGCFDVEEKEKKLQELISKTQNSSFWNNNKEAEEVFNQINIIKNKITPITDLGKRINDSFETLLLLEDIYDEDLKLEFEKELLKLPQEIKKLQLEVMLKADYDKNNAILEIHSGAGGTEACDWTSMLLRMYSRWLDKYNFKYEIIDSQDGEEAGLRRVVLLCKGINAYGYLKSEKGIHRLVRISPFDSGNRRHTSFASVNITPEIEDSIEIVIGDEDLKIDVYRSSGAGGQSVNTTDSAVRVTHIPSGIVVTCQNERSQIKNKESAIRILKSKLYQLEQEKIKKTIAALKGDNVEINFGSQIRSYVMHPYSMVKDHRTNCETSNVTKILDGDIDMFIEAYLKQEVTNENR